MRHSRFSLHSTRKLLTALAAPVLLTASLVANAAPGELGSLGALTEQSPSAWAQTRAQLLSNVVGGQNVAGSPGALLRGLVESRRATVAPGGAWGDGAWSEKEWRASAMVLVIDAAIKDPLAIEEVGRLQGIDPAIYLRARRPLPLGSRELSRKKLPIGTLLEAWFFAREEPLQRAAAFYPEAQRDNYLVLRTAEALALQEALLTAIAKTRHAVAVPLLLTALEATSARRRELAAVLLGQTRQPSAQTVLVSMINDQNLRGPLRSAALVGLGKMRSLLAVKLLAKEAARDDRSSTEHLAAIGGLANAGNRYAHRAAPMADAEAIRVLASKTLTDLLPTYARNQTLAAALAQAIATVGHSSATPSLQALSEKGSVQQRSAARQALALHSRALRRR